MTTVNSMLNLPLASFFFIFPAPLVSASPDITAACPSTVRQFQSPLAVVLSG